MKTLKGFMTIELTDQHGNKQIFKKTNMVTNAVSDLLSENPAGVFTKLSDNEEILSWQDHLLPIAKHMIGGILLFSKALTEDPDNLYPPSDNLPVALSNALVEDESYALKDGYRFVFSFDKDQANDTIASVALTSFDGGSSPYLAPKLLNVKKAKITEDLYKKALGITSINYNNNELCAVTMVTNDGKKEMRLAKYHCPLTKMTINDDLSFDPDLLKKFDESTSGVYKDSAGHYCFISASRKDETYAISTSPDKKKMYVAYESGGNFYSISTYSCDTENAILIGIADPEAFVSYGLMRDDNLYILDESGTKIYKFSKVSMGDPSYTTIDLGFTSAHRSVNGTSLGHFLILFNDLIIGYDFAIDANDNAIKLDKPFSIPHLMTHLFPYKEFLVGFTKDAEGYFLNWYINPSYLATINNITPITKTDQQTLKIIYTLKEA